MANFSPQKFGTIQYNYKYYYAFVCILIYNNYIIELLQLCQCVFVYRYVDSNVGVQFGPDVFADNPRLTVM